MPSNLTFTCSQFFSSLPDHSLVISLSETILEVGKAPSLPLGPLLSLGSSPAGTTRPAAVNMPALSLPRGLLTSQPTR